MQLRLDLIASWPTPNYVDPEVHGPASVVVELLLVVLVTLLLSIRLYTRCKISRCFGRDDVFIFMAYVPATAFVVNETAAHYKLERDRHIWDIRPEFAVPLLKVSLAQEILFALAAGFTKLSVLALIYRVTSVAPGWTKHVVAVVAALVALDSLVFILVSIFQCSPVSDAWTLSFRPQRCIDQGIHLLAASIINTVQDFAIVLLPVKTVICLNLPWAQRMTVLVLFAGGLLVSAAGAVRTYYTWLLVYSPEGDLNWHAYDMTLASVVELFLGIVCASAPATKPFFDRYLPRLIRGSGASTDTGGWSDKRTTANTRTSAAISGSTFVANSDGNRPFSLKYPGGPRHHRGSSTPPDLNKPLPRFPTAVLSPVPDRGFKSGWDEVYLRPRSPSPFQSLVSEGGARTRSLSYAPRYDRYSRRSAHL